MPAEGNPNLRFEPPPWEKEAFDRFEQERAKRRAAEELEEQLRAVRQPARTPDEAVRPTPAAAEDAASLSAPEQAAPAPQVPAGAQETARERPGSERPAGLPDSRIQAMLVELRMEEPSPAQTNMALINSVIGVFSTIGVVIIVQAAVLFARARSIDAAATMLAATMSFVVLLAGLGFVAGAILLFRKYHR